MEYHFRLKKGRSYYGCGGRLKATAANPDVYTNDEEIAKAAIASSYFSAIERKPVETVEAHLDPAQFADMGLKDLKVLAADMGIDTKNLKSKEAIIAAIAAEKVIPGPEDDGGENEADYGETE